MKRILSVIAVVVLVVGFGTIHSTNPIVERVGSILIGLGSIYLIVILLKSKKKDSSIE